MKKLIIILCIVALGSWAYAQNATNKTSMKEGVIKKDGQMWYIKLLPDSMQFDNGTTVYSNGTVKTADNKTYKLEEGDRLNFDGLIAGFEQKIDIRRGLVLMANNNVWVWSILDRPLLLANGEYVMPDCSLRLRAGKYVKLNDKDFITFDGTISMVSQ